MAAPIRAALMITCLGDMFFPEVGVAMVRLLRGLGVEVDFPEGQTCCGMPLFNSGYDRDAALVAARTVKLFERAEHVVVPSGSCAFMVKTEYPGLLKHDPALRAAAESLARRTRELSQFLVEVLGVSRVDSSPRPPAFLACTANWYVVSAVRPVTVCLGTLVAGG